jgi:hypothetical protein
MIRSLVNTFLVVKRLAKRLSQMLLMLEQRLIRPRLMLLVSKILERDFMLPRIR